MRFSGADIEFRLSTVRRPEISSAGHQLSEGKLAEFARNPRDLYRANRSRNENFAVITPWTLNRE